MHGERIRAWYLDQAWRYANTIIIIIGPATHLALNITDCAALCLSDEELKAVCPFYLVSMPVEVKYPTQEENV